MTAIQLPAFPTTQTLNSLIPTIQSTLQRYTSSTTQNDSSTYIATYAKHRAYSTLQNIVWGTDTKIPEEIIQLTLLIAQRTTRTIAVHTLIDLSVVYAHSYLDQLQQVFQAQYNLYPLQLTESITNDAVPTFIRLLAGSDAHQALTSKRKISESIVSFLHACSPILALIRPFALSKDFILSLASLYDAGLTSIAKSHGGYSVLLSHTIDDADDWPRIWVQTKIAVIDSFHIVLTALLDDLSSQPREVGKEHLFDTLFALVDLSVAPPSTAPPTPFLNLPLIADYQHAYNLLEKMSSILNESPFSPQSERDPRLDLLEATLSSLLSSVEKKNPGVLKIVLRSKTKTKSPIKSKSTPAPKASTPNNEEESAASLESKTAQILAILPHLSSSHVNRLLRDDRFGGNVERVLEGLLDGSLGSEWEDVDQAEGQQRSRKGKQRAKLKDDERGDAFGYDVSQRRNVFETEELDVTRMRVGKQNVGSDLQDRSTIERMKRDILRRVEEMVEAEAELFEEEDTRNWKDKAKGRSDAVYDEDEIGVVAASTSMGRIRLLGDGESDTDESESESESDDVGGKSGPLDPETIIEQAYLRDPRVFDRDASTRRGISRIELRNLTGWADEQIEGWKVMLERTPGKKAKLEEKHAFRGNVKGLEVHGPGQSRSSGFGGRGRRPPRAGAAAGNSRGENSRGSRRGGGRGGSNRKRGHDKKIARAGGTI